MEQEIWKDIPNYEGTYQVSNLGRVRSVSHTVVNNKNGGKRTVQSRLLKQEFRNGYLVVYFCKDRKRKQFSVHRLVAQAFCVNPNNYTVVNHIDFNKTNNNANNLEWCTQLQNTRYSYKNFRKAMNDKKRRLQKGEMYGITYKKQCNRYEVYINLKYHGRYSTLDEAKKKRDKILKEMTL